MRELLSGAAVSSDCTSDLVLPRGVRLPTEPKLEGERSLSDEERDEVERKLDLDGESENTLTEYALAAVSEAEALELR